MKLAPFIGVLLCGVLSYVAGWRQAGESHETSLLAMVAIAAITAPFVARDGTAILIALVVGLLCGFAGYFDRRR